MKYIESLHIERFRGFKDFNLNELKDINILVGDNNTGKTTILEAINVLEYPGEIGHYINVCSKREGKGKLNQYNIFMNSISKDDFVLKKRVNIEGIINKKEIACYIYGDTINVIKSNSENGEVEAFEGTIGYRQNSENIINEEKLYIDEDTDRLKISSKNSFSTVKMLRILPYEHIDKELESSVIKQGKKQEIVDILKIFDKNILGFELIEEDKQIKVYIQHKETGMLPISSYGDGLKKVFYLSSAIIKAKGGILLIDEIETSIHFSILEQIFKFIIEASIKYNVQLFATTHSLEAVDALLNCANEIKGTSYLKESISVITLKKDEINNNNKNVVRRRILDGFRAFNFREDFNMELR